jgi:(hydroxyamino)benzene mutase
MEVQRGGRQILLHGMAFILAGLLWGMMVPLAPFPRLALGAHIQFELNGILYIIVAVLLLKLPHAVGRKSIVVILVAVWTSWLMAISEAANAWWGTNQTLPIAAAQAGAVGGEFWQELTVKLSHIVSALALLIAWFLLIVGFWRAPAAHDSTD